MQSKRRVHVLVVEDDEDLLDIVGGTLELEGHDVDVAGNGAIAVMRASIKRPDVVLFDLTMPGADGSMLLDELRQRFSPPPIMVAMSGALSAVGWASRQEIAMFLVKPFDGTTLRLVVDEAARRATANPAARSSTDAGVVLALASAMRDARFASIADELVERPILVVESEGDAAQILDNVPTKLVIVGDAASSGRVRAAASAHGVPVRSVAS